ncbi:hypothetical protein VNO78_35528 [Psophocarpus tetragonolobus]|uniref:Uncharacterized protein n=1 Tax=Psophocarpus tetragonolobus TaxID=3891 RepID=A0AAN9NLP3_PSOTE
MSDSLVRVSRRAEWGATGRRQEHARAEARPRAHAAIHNRHDDVSASISTARAWATVAIRIGPVPESIGGPALAVPHPTGAHRRPPSASLRQFQALFDSLFKVLFIFPSRYLFAIGLSPVLGLGRIYRPIGGCIPKQPDSPTAPRGATGSGTRGSHPLWRPLPGDLGPVRTEDASPDYNSNARGDRFSWWLFPRVAPPDLRSRYERLRDVYKMGHGACPQPNGFGRNLRSKTRWFTGFCNSHQVSHFATFFIDARAEISVAESHFASCVVTTPAGHRLRVPKNRPLQFTYGNLVTTSPSSK